MCKIRNVGTADALEDARWQWPGRSSYCGGFQDSYHCESLSAQTNLLPYSPTSPYSESSGRNLLLPGARSLCMRHNCSTRAKVNMPPPQVKILQAVLPSPISGDSSIRNTIEHQSRKQDSSEDNLDKSSLIQLLRLARRQTVEIVESRWFDIAVSFVILTNSVLLALDNPLDDPNSTLQRIISVAEDVFLSLFTLEMFLKIFAKGFIWEDGAYLRDSWNVVDFVIVIISYGELLPFIGDSGLTAFRTVRVLRSLRTIVSNKSLRILVSSILKIFKLIGDVAALLAFTFFLFGLIGMQLFSGKLRQRCFFNDTCKQHSYAAFLLCRSTNNVTVLLNEMRTESCSVDSNGYQCDVGQFCADSGYNPSGGIIGFDNILLSWLTVLQCISLEGWVDVMYITMNATTPWSSIYFILLILLGSFFACELVLGVVWNAYNDAKKENESIELASNPIVKHAKDEQAGAIDTPRQIAIPMDSGDCQFTLLLICRRIVSHKIFKTFVLFAIFMNAAMMASRHEGQTEVWTNILETGNIIFNALFTVEVILNIIAYWGVYLRDKFNRFDLFIIIVGWIDIILSALDIQQYWTRAVRMGRVLRIFKISRRFPNFYNLLLKVAKSWSAAIRFTLIILIFAFVYALVGLQLFAGKMIDENGQRARANFDYFGWSMITVFQIIGGENWNEIMETAVRGTNYSAVLYFVTLYLLGKCTQSFIHSVDHYELINICCLHLVIFLNLFLAILMSSSGTEDMVNTEESRVSLQHNASIMPLRLNESNQHTLVIKDSKTSLEKGVEIEIGQLFAIQGTSSTRRALGNSINHVDDGSDELSFMRRYVYALISNRDFDGFILLCIIITTIDLAIQSGFKNLSTSYNSFSQCLSFVSTMVFSMEACLKIYGYGPNVYFHSGWNILDFFVAFTSLLDTLLLRNDNVSFMKILRLFRAFRPITMISRLKELRIIVNVIALSIPKVIMVQILVVVIYFAFAVIGMQLFGGRLKQCFDKSTGEAVQLNRDMCYGDNEWRNPSIGHFGNIFSSFLLLFEVSSMEMWPSYMYATVDIPDHPHLHPVRDNYPGNALYFVVFICIANFFLQNLFVGVVIESFTHLKDEMMSGSKLLTPLQAMWIELKKLVLDAAASTESSLTMSSTSNHHQWRRSLFNCVTHPRFELVFISLVVVNIMCMSLSYYGVSNVLSTTLQALDTLFTIVFVVEAILKIIGLGLYQYLSICWNAIDMIIVLLSLVPAIEFMLNRNVSSTSIDPTIFRIFRIPKLLRLLNFSRFKSLRQMITTLVLTLPSLFSIATLLFMSYFIFALIGVILYSGLAHGEYLSRNANFDHLSLALLTLFRVSTGESWNGMMHEMMMMTKTLCNDSDTDNDWCLSHYLLVPYFISFICIVSYLILNLFVAVIMGHFEHAMTRSQIPKNHNVDDGVIRKFTEEWRKIVGRPPLWKFWSDQGDWLNVDSFCILIESVPPPLGTYGRNVKGVQLFSAIDFSAVTVYESLDLSLNDADRNQLELNQRQFYVHYYEVILCCVYAAIRMHQGSTNNSTSNVELSTLSQDIHENESVSKKLKNRFRSLSIAQNSVGEHKRNRLSLLSRVSSRIQSVRGRFNRLLGNSRGSKSSKDIGFSSNLSSNPSLIPQKRSLESIVVARSAMLNRNIAHPSNDNVQISSPHT